jgi:hypothetical protein
MQNDVTNANGKLKQDAWGKVGQTKQKNEKLHSETGKLHSEKKAGTNKAGTNPARTLRKPKPNRIQSLSKPSKNLKT